MGMAGYWSTRFASFNTRVLLAVGVTIGLFAGAVALGFDRLGMGIAPPVFAWLLTLSLRRGRRLALLLDAAMQPVTNGPIDRLESLRLRKTSAAKLSLPELDENELAELEVLERARDAGWL
jgi:hypothetical protein